MILPNWASDILSSRTAKLKKTSITVKTCNNCYNDHWNLEVDVLGCRFHCWVCDYGGGIRKYLGDNNITYENGDITLQTTATNDGHLSVIKMPESRRLCSNTSRYAEEARRFLRGRGVGDIMIKDLNLRVAIDDDWWGYILYPFYGLSGLEFFMGISFMKSAWLKYRFPEGSKDIYCPIRRPTSNGELVLVEGFFDMTTVYRYTNYDILPLLGKFVLSKQTDYIEQSNYRKVHACLDGSAMQENLSIAKRLDGYGIPMYVVKLPDDKDPDDCKEGIADLVAGSEKYNVALAVRLKLGVL